MNIIFRYLEICFFKASPADVVSSHWIMKATLLAYFVTGSISLSYLGQTWEVSLFASLADTFVMMLVVWLLLQIRDFTLRFQQTVTAMAGIGTCIGIVSIPISYFFLQVKDNQQLAGIAALLMLAIMIWNVMVIAHVFRTALEIRPGSAVLLTVAYALLSLMVLGLTASGVA